jgi:SagB-type dehydrogenase family enzyme
MKKYLLCSCIILCLEQFPTSGQDIVLPEPRKDGGIPLMEAINKRKSTRDFSSYDISEQVLSDMLWAAYGFNRPQEKKRTVPSAYNIQNMKIYLATANGLYLYDAESNGLNLILSEDIRAQTGTQEYVKDASVNLVYVADMSMMASTGDRGEFYSIAHAGFISQNVYLFCASFDLGTTVRDLIDRETLEITMQLEDDEEIILAQSVGYPEGYIPSETEEKKYSEGYSLSQNFPNPFSLNTQINYTLAENAHVTVNIYDLKGEKIKTILNKNQKSGNYNFEWNGLNDNGEKMASVIYFCKIDINNINNQFTQTRKMIMLK